MGKLVDKALLKLIGTLMSAIVLVANTHAEPLGKPRITSKSLIGSSKNAPSTAGDQPSLDMSGEVPELFRQSDAGNGGTDPSPQAIPPVPEEHLPAADSAPSSQTPDPARIEPLLADIPTDGSDSQDKIKKAATLNSIFSNFKTTIDTIYNHLSNGETETAWDELTTLQGKVDEVLKNKELLGDFFDQEWNLLEVSEMLATLNEAVTNQLAQVPTYSEPPSQASTETPNYLNHSDKEMKEIAAQINDLNEQAYKTKARNDIEALKTGGKKGLEDKIGNTLTTWRDDQGPRGKVYEVRISRGDRILFLETTDGKIEIIFVGDPHQNGGVYKPAVINLIRAALNE